MANKHDKVSSQFLLLHFTLTFNFHQNIHYFTKTCNFDIKRHKNPILKTENDRHLLMLNFKGSSWCWMNHDESIGII